MFFETIQSIICGTVNRRTLERLILDEHVTVVIIWLQFETFSRVSG